MKKKGIITALAAALCVAAFAQTATAATARSYDELITALNGSDAQITLTAPITATELITVERNVTLDLAGRALTGSATNVIAVINNATLTVNDSKSGGMIENTLTASAASVIRIGSGTAGGVVGTGGTVILNGGTFKCGSSSSFTNSYGVELVSNCSAAQVPEVATSLTVNEGVTIEAGYVGIYAQGKTATVNINGGEIKAVAYAVSGNGTTSGANHGGTVINVNGGTITSTGGGVGIFHPQAGTLTVNGGTITGYDGIQMKSGTLVVNGGVITGDGKKGAIGSSNGNDETGAAVSIISVGGESGSYAGNINATFNGGTLISEQENAIFEAQADGAVTKFESLTITGGTFTGAEGNKDAISMTNVTTDENGVSNTNITGGMFSSDPNECQGMENANIAEGTLDENGNYVISAPTPAPAPSAPQHSGGGSGGCSAGFGALALLAAVPLLRMRKK